MLTLHAAAQLGAQERILYAIILPPRLFVKVLQDVCKCECKLRGVCLNVCVQAAWGGVCVRASVRACVGCVGAGGAGVQECRGACLRGCVRGQVRVRVAAWLRVCALLLRSGFCR